MLQAIKQFFEQNIATPQSNTDAEREHSLQLATAALLFEMMRMDDEIDEDEKQLVLRQGDNLGCSQPESG